LLIAVITPYLQAFTQAKQPMHCSGWTMITCLCHKKPTFPNTACGQALMQLQQASHLRPVGQIKRVANVLMFLTLKLRHKSTAVSFGGQ
jgi:hypothetical protein